MRRGAQSRAARGVGFAIAPRLPPGLARPEVRQRGHLGRFFLLPIIKRVWQLEKPARSGPSFLRVN
jgi:hypothetical protein